MLEGMQEGHSCILEPFAHSTFSRNLCRSDDLTVPTMYVGVLAAPSGEFMHV